MPVELSSKQSPAVPDSNRHGGEAGHRLPALMLGAIGIVYGDIGTSPLYTLREAFGHAGGLPLREPAILGVLSLVFWSLVVVVTLKYVTVIMRADNRGEGGVLALTALALRGAQAGTLWHTALVGAGMLGTALFFGDSLITPAISVLSAVEGLQIATPLLEPYVVPIAVAVLLALFVVQRRGTGGVGRLFGPVMCLWFAILAVLGLIEIWRYPDVLRALDPRYAAELFMEHGWRTFLALGAIVLAVTGAEALYADMGHFGRQPIRLAWLFLVLPALVLNYFGQGALLIHDPSALANPFFLLVPSWGLYPMVLLATVATVIASQAVISGAFSLTRQAVQLGYLPRREIRHTSSAEIGQVYIPRTNWVLLVGVLALVIGFQSSSNLASAYGISVTGAMIIDGLLAYVVVRYLWRWSRPFALLVFSGFLLVDLAYFGANVLKILQGGWFPLVVAAGMFFIMSTWWRGRQALSRRLYSDAMPVGKFLERLDDRFPARVPGTAVFMTGNPDYVPHAMLHNIKHNKVLHERVIIMTVLTRDVPWVREENRYDLQVLDRGFYRLVIYFGFIERPNVLSVLNRLDGQGLTINLMETSFFLGRETLIPSSQPDLSPLREQTFIALHKTTTSATEFFCIPPNRVVELGTQIEI